MALPTAATALRAFGTPAVLGLLVVFFLVAIILYADKKLCIGRELNPGLQNGNLKCCHYTTDATELLGCYSYIF